MDPGILSQITLLFKNASLVWAPSIGQIMAPLPIQLMAIGWFFMLVSEVFVPGWGLFPALLVFFIGQGFALWMVQDGWFYIDDVFAGVKQIGIMLGADIDPSATAALGPVVSYPIMKSLADQGAWSYFTSPITIVYALAGLAYDLAFLILAFMEMGLLILSYVLTSACGFFFAFAGTTFTRPMTMTYVRLVFGCLASLFVVLLIKCISTEVATLLHQQLTAHFSVPGKTFTWNDYAMAGGPAVVLLSVFIWLPAHIGRQAYGMMPDWGGARAAVNLGGSVVNSTMPSSSNGGGGGGGGSGPAQVSSSQGSSGGGGSGGFSGSQASSQRPVSAWGK